MTGTQIKKLRASMKMSCKEFAEAIGVSISSVYKWEDCTRGPSKPAIKLMRKMRGAGNE